MTEQIEHRSKPRRYKFGVSIPNWIALAGILVACLGAIIVQAQGYGSLKTDVKHVKEDVAKFEQDYKIAIKDSEGRLMTHITSSQNQTNIRIQNLEDGIQTILREMPRK